jgi:hypothetical protein
MAGSGFLDEASRRAILMSQARVLLSIGLCLSTQGVVVFAQTAATQTKPVAGVASTGKDRPQSERAEAESEVTRIQQRGVSIIREAATDASNLEDKRLISRIEVRAATALWKFDRDGAKELFEKAFETALAFYRETKDTNSRQRASGTNVTIPDARQDVIRALMKLDPTTAKAMTERLIEERSHEISENYARNVAADLAKPGGPGKSLVTEGVLGKPDPAGNEIFGLAYSLFEVDREASLALARRALESSIPSNIAGYLVTVANVDRRSADQLFLFALSRLGAQDPPVPGQLLLLAAYPFGDDRVVVSDGNSTSSYGFGRPRAFEIDPSLVKAFFARAVDVLARTSQLNVSQFPELLARVHSGLFAARYLEAKVVQYEPALVDRWAALAAALYANATDQSRNGIARQMENSAREQKAGPNQASEDRIKEALDSAEKMTDFVRKDEAYAQVAVQLGLVDMTRALSIADKISDMEFRQNVRDWLNFNASSDALGARKFEEARRYAMEVSVTDQRAYLLFQIAATLIKDKDRVRAIDALEEAAKGALAAENSADKLRALLGITSVYAEIDSTRAFDVAAEAVKTAGSVENYSYETATLSRTLRRKGGSSSSNNSQSAEGFDVGRTLSMLARADFERALGLAQAIENRPLRLLTVIAVANTVLETK